MFGVHCCIPYDDDVIGAYTSKARAVAEVRAFILRISETYRGPWTVDSIADPSSWTTLDGRELTISEDGVAGAGAGIAHVLVYCDTNLGIFPTREAALARFAEAFPGWTTENMHIWEIDVDAPLESEDLFHGYSERGDPGCVPGCEVQAAQYQDEGESEEEEEEKK